MSAITQNKNTKNSYVNSLIDEFKEITNDTKKSVKMDE